MNSFFIVKKIFLLIPSFLFSANWIKKMVLYVFVLCVFYLIIKYTQLIVHVLYLEHANVVYIL